MVDSNPSERTPNRILHNTQDAPGSAAIVYFSGTGCTARCAETLRSSLETEGLQTGLFEVRIGNDAASALDADLIVFMYPVHAFDTPDPLYEVLERMTGVSQKRTAVISVSGAGDMFPNRACRYKLCRKLEAKGFRVEYEAMLAMPSNFFVATPHAGVIGVLQALPARCDRIAHDLAVGKTLRPRVPLSDRLFSKVALVEKIGQKYFGQRIRVGDSCTSCGWCSRACPQGNIALEGGIPRFGPSCVFCLRCLYGCPGKALTPGLIPPIVIKDGFSLAEMERQAQGELEIDLTEVDNVLWSGVHTYLSDRTADGA